MSRKFPIGLPHVNGITQTKRLKHATDYPSLVNWCAYTPIYTQHHANVRANPSLCTKHVKHLVLVIPATSCCYPKLWGPASPFNCQYTPSLSVPTTLNIVFKKKESEVLPRGFGSGLGL
jgi:hypothetical protein